MFTDELLDSFGEAFMINLAGNAMETSCLLSATLTHLVVMARFYAMSLPQDEQATNSSRSDSGSSSESESASVALGLRTNLVYPHHLAQFEALSA